MMETQIEWMLVSGESRQTRQCAIGRTIIAGWTGRDTAAMEEHIIELEKLGIARPTHTPIFYRVSASRVTTASRIEAVGNASSGEIEFFLLNLAGEIWVGVGSDHTDRKAETQCVTLSKQMCDKPVASQLWRLAEVAAHWESIQLRSYAVFEGKRTLYQEGCVTAMLSPEELMQRYAHEDTVGGGLGPGDLMMCGTLPAIGGVRSASHFAFEMEDPVLKRRIEHAYAVAELPVEG